MKRSYFRVAAAMTAAFLLLAITAGCKRDEADRLDEPDISLLPDFAYIAETVKLPRDMGAIRNTTYHDGRVYFIANGAEADTAAPPYLSGSVAGIYSMNIDGTDIARLEGYAPPTQIPEGTDGHIGIQAMDFDSEGNIWVAEAWGFYRLDLPEGFDGETDDAWQYWMPVEKGGAIRKLDASGIEIATVDISALSALSARLEEPLYIEALAVVGEPGSEAVCISSPEYGEDGASATVYILGGDGDVKCKAHPPEIFDCFLKLQDGNVAFATGQNAGAAGAAELQTIDIAAGALGGKAAIPASATAPLSGRSLDFYNASYIYDYLINDGLSLYGIKQGGDMAEAEKLLSWLDCNAMLGYLQGIAITEDGHIICTQYIWDEQAGRAQTELAVLTKTPRSELPERIVLTLATIGATNLIGEDVANFNRTNPYYEIVVKDYIELVGGFGRKGAYEEAEMLFNTDITAGKIPDIIDLANMPYRDYAEMGLLVDLYPFIDADPEISRDDFITEALDAFEVNGSLHIAFREFMIVTLVGNPAFVGQEIGWTPDELATVMDKRPDADLPIGQSMRKTSFLERVITLSIDDFIDRETGTAHFDSEQFVQILQIANRLPDDIYSVKDRDDIEITREEAVSEGRQFAYEEPIFGFHPETFRYAKALFGEGVVVKGYPSTNGNHHTISPVRVVGITEQSERKDAAWSFARTFLIDDNEQFYIGSSFSPIKTVFDRGLQNGLEGCWREDDGSTNKEGIGEKVALSQEDVDVIMTLIRTAICVDSSDDGLMNIIIEDASDYFSGIIDAQTAAKRIQERAAIYLSERS